MKKILFITILNIFILQSCQTDPEDNCLRTIESISGNYMVSEIMYKASAGANFTDYTSNVLDDCERDDVIVLKADGTYQRKDEGNKCTPLGNETGVWSINGSKIIIDGEEADITFFNCFDKLEFVLSDVYVTGDKMKFVYVHQ